MNRNRNTINQHDYKGKGKQCPKKKGSKSKNRRDMDENPQNIDRETKVNDPNWYFIDKVLMDQAGRITMNKFVGSKFQPNNLMIPSIMTVYMNPSPGVVEAGDQTAGINMAAQRLYADLSAFTGRTSQYAPQDIATLLLQLGELISISSHLRRVFGTVHAVNQLNRSVPENAINLMGIDYDDLVSAKNNYIKRFNALMTVSQKIVFPINISYFAKCNDMYNYIYMDRDDPMAQLILVRPRTTWAFEEATDQHGTYLRTVDLPIRPGQTGIEVEGTMESWLDFLSSMITSLLTSSTLNVIYSDIRNMATKMNIPLISLPLITSDYTVAPVYNEGILEQIHNLQTAKLPQKSTANPFITGCTNYNDVEHDPSTNTIKHVPCVAVNSDYGAIVQKVGEAEIVLDFFDSNPSTERVIEATRMIALDNYKVSGPTQGVFTAHKRFTEPDHYVSGIFVSTNDLSRASGYSDIVPTTMYGTEGTSGFPVVLPVDAAKLSAFRHGPVLTVNLTDASTVASSTQYKDSIRIGELTGYTSVDSNYIKSTHDLATLSLFSLR